MKKQLYTHIRTFALFIFIASFTLSANHANAQEREARAEDPFKGLIFTEHLSNYLEIGVATGNLIYAPSETRNDDGYNSLFVRTFLTLNDKKCCLFIDTEAAYSRTETSEVDGLTRQDQFGTIGVGYVFNKEPKQTTSFYTLSTGLLFFNHFVRGNAAWNPESDALSDEQILYEKYGLYVQAEIGMKIKNRHKLYLYYIHPFAQQGSTAKNASPTFLGANGPVNHSVAVPDEIVEGIVGFRYSIMLLRRQR
ncbi:MAG: hypothetical protein K0U39_09150 [Alphaproteobacteria bacterium]|nr:hypothetical protein [Alphaproteobacteria bacterium]